MSSPNAPEDPVGAVKSGQSIRHSSDSLETSQGFDVSLVGYITTMTFGRDTTHSERAAVLVFEHLTTAGRTITLNNVVTVLREWRNHPGECDCGRCELARWTRPDPVWWAMRGWTGA